MTKNKLLLINQIENQCNTLLETEEDLYAIPHIIEQDLLDIISMCFKDLSTNIDINDIEEKLEKENEIDIAYLNDFIESLKNNPPLKKDHKIISREINFDKTLKQVQEFLKELKNNKKHIEEKKGMIEFGVIKRGLESLLYCYSDETCFPEKILNLFEKKLDSFKQKDLFILWNSILKEFDQEERYHCNFSREIELLPDNFFKINSYNIVKRISLYFLSERFKIIKYRAQTYKESSTPFEEYPVAYLLSIKDNINTITPQEKLISSIISRIFFYIKKFLYKDYNELSNILELNHDSKIISGYYIEMQTNKIKQTTKLAKPKIQHIIYDLKKLIVLIDEYISKSTNIESALTRYKLGLEICLPKILDIFDNFFQNHEENEHELELQKKLCKYLLDQKIYSFGTKFGQNETDLIIEENPNTYIIEAKVYRTKTPPSPEKITTNLSQLQTYIANDQPGKQGILIIYNFSKTLLKVEKNIWFKGIYKIIPINLGESASKRKNTLTIFESKSKNEIINFYYNNK